MTEWLSLLEFNPKPLKLWMKTKIPNLQDFHGSLLCPKRVFALCLETSSSQALAP